MFTCAIRVLLISFLVSSTAHAGQVLLTIDLKLGSTDAIASAALKKYAQFALRKNFRKVYIVTKSSGDSTKDAILKIKKDRLEGESLDIISFQHGPDISLFWDMSMEDFSALLGSQNIRYVFSSGCKMWGSVEFNRNGEAALSQRNHIVDRVRKLKPKEAILFTNNQSYTTHLMDPILNLSEQTSSLKEIFLLFFVQEDIKNTQLLDELSKNITNENWLYAYWNNNLSVNPIARPVFIEPIQETYQETLYAIPSPLWTSVLNLCSALEKTHKLRYQQMATAICRFK